MTAQVTHVQDIPGVVEWVRHGDAFEVVYEPGNGSRYATTFVQTAEGYYLVALPEFRCCYVFPLWDSHPAYIAEKLRLSISDGEALAVLFAAVWESSR